MNTETRPPDQLRPHPLNEAIYGREDDAEMQASIKHLGVLTPLLVDENGTIYSGHRRHRAALAIGLSIVPVIVHETPTPLDGERLLLESNKQRIKTASQVVAEGKALERIIAEEAKERQKRKPLDSVVPILAQQKAVQMRKTRTQVAEGVGMKPSTYANLEKVYDIAKGDQPAPAEVQEVAKEQMAKLDAGQTTIHAAEQKVRAALTGPNAEQRQQAEAEATELQAAIMGADAAINDGGVAKISLLRELGKDIRGLLHYDQAEVCAAFQRHPHMDHILTDIHRVRRLLANIERECGTIVGGKGLGVG